MTREELLALPVSVGLTKAGEAFGFSRMTSYRLATTGRFPVPVKRHGHKYVVATALILKELGIEPDTPRGGSSAAQTEGGAPLD